MIKKLYIGAVALVLSGIPALAEQPNVVVIVDDDLMAVSVPAPQRPLSSEKK